MKACRKCGNPLSLKVDQCPACGAAVKKRTSGCAILGIVGVAAAVIFGVLASKVADYNEGLPSSSPVVANKEDSIEAWSMAQQHVKESLKSPSTASFGGLFDQIPKDNVEKVGDNRYLVRIWVDSQNGVGATVRTYFLVMLKRENDGSWRLLMPPQVVPR